MKTALFFVLVMFVSVYAKTDESSVAKITVKDVAALKTIAACGLRLVRMSGPIS